MSGNVRRDRGASFWTRAWAAVAGVAAVPLASATIWYVDASAPPGGDGTSWANAFNDLHAALSHPQLVSGDQIWVAAGTYKPSVPFAVGNVTPTARHKTFHLPEDPLDVLIFGGFLGLADPGGGETSLSQRNPEQNETILSGDIGVTGDDSDNAYHVVVALDVSPQTRLSGFTITGGRADGAQGLDMAGGGILITEQQTTSRPQITRCVFRDNSAENGGGMAIITSNPGPPVQIVNCRFENNTGMDSGGAFVSGDAVFTNCVFRNNTSQGGQRHSSAIR